MKPKKNVWSIDPDDPTTARLVITRRNGQQFTVLTDIDLAPQLARQCWRIHSSRTTTYAVSGCWNNGTCMFLHRIVADTPADQEAHFVNNDSLDCRRANLRNGGRIDTRLNSRTVKCSGRQKSGHPYIKHRPDRGHWYTEALIDGRRQFVGVYKLLTEAVRAQADYYHQHAAKSVEA